MNNSAEATVKTAPTGDYPVGFGRPPKHSQFKKGQSGNPKGRPKKTATKELLFEEEVKRVVYDEAYRLVPLRQGDRTLQGPMIQALARAMLVKGLQGNSRLLCKAFDFLTQIEGERRDELLKDLENAFDFKEYARREREKCAAEGKPAPEFVIDPDAIELDFAQGAVRFRGPATPEARKEHARLVETKENWERELREIEAMLKETPDDPQLLKELADVKKILKTLKRAGA